MSTKVAVPTNTRSPVSGQDRNLVEGGGALFRFLVALFLLEALALVGVFFLALAIAPFLAVGVLALGFGFIASDAAAPAALDCSMEKEVS